MQEQRRTAQIVFFDRNELSGYPYIISPSSMLDFFETIITFLSILYRHLKDLVSLLPTKLLLQTGFVASTVTILFGLKLENLFISVLLKIVTCS